MKPSSGDDNGIDTDTSRTHISIQPSSINKFDTQVDDNDPKEGDQTIPEGKESVVAEKNDDHHLKPASGDAVEIAMIRTHSEVKYGPINNIDTQVDDDNPNEDNHTFPVEKAPVVAEKSQGDKISGPPNQLFFI